jgi:hypothetical protein
MAFLPDELVIQGLMNWCEEDSERTSGPLRISRTVVTNRNNCTQTDRPNKNREVAI